MNVCLFEFELLLYHGVFMYVYATIYFNHLINLIDDYVATLPIITSLSCYYCLIVRELRQDMGHQKELAILHCAFHGINCGPESVILPYILCTFAASLKCLFMPLKEDIMFFTQSLGLSVCLCVCVSVIRIVTRWLDLATRY